MSRAVANDNRGFVMRISLRDLTPARSRFVLPVLAAALLGLTGCYTELAVVERVYDREPDYVEVEERDGTVVERYYYDDDDYYYDDCCYYDPYRYRRYFTRFHVGIGYFHDPFWWDPFYYSWHFYDPFYYDPFFYVGWGFRPFHYYSPFYHHHYYPSYAYVFWPYYGGWRYDAPGVIRGRRGSYEPRGVTLGRGGLAGIRSAASNAVPRGASRSSIGRSGFLNDEIQGGTARGITRVGSSTATRSGSVGSVTRESSASRGASRGTVDRSTTGTSGSRGTVGRSTTGSTGSRSTVRSAPASRASGSRGTVSRPSSSGSSGSRGTVSRPSSSSSGSRGSVSRPSSSSGSRSSSSGSSSSSGRSSSRGGRN